MEEFQSREQVLFLKACFLPFYPKFCKTRGLIIENTEYMCKIYVKEWKSNMVSECMCHFWGIKVACLYISFKFSLMHIKVAEI